MLKCMQLFHKQNYFGPITFSLFLYCCSGKAPGDRGLLNPEIETNALIFCQTSYQETLLFVIVKMMK